MKFRVFLLLTLSLLLSACGGGGDSSDGGSASASAEVLAPQARDSYDQLLTANQPNAGNDVSLRDRVSDPQGLALRLLSVQPLASQCQPPVVNSEALSFRVDNGSADACTYAYTIENVPTNGATPKRTQATSYVVISAASSPAMLPILSHTAVVNETIAIDLARELGGDFPAGFTLQPEVIVLGSGTALADPASNTISYTAAAVPGITRLVYSYLSADGTEVRAGAIDVSVSKSADGMPLAENFPGPEDVLPGAVVTVDVKDHISDPNGDPLQLTYAYAFDATVSATDATSSNTRFDFVADKPGSYDVSYYVTDHNGGYAIGVVRITVQAKGLWHDIVLSDGSRYTAPWEKNLADGLGIPYQDVYEEANATGTYQVALFNYDAAQTLCAARGMTLPSVAELNKLHGEKPDPSSSDNWPVERPYWASDALDENSNGQVYDLVSGTATTSSIAIPQGATCIYAGVLAALDTTVDNQYVNTTPAPEKQDEVEALVTNGDGTPAANKNVYFYASNPDLIFSQKQMMTDGNGKAKVTIESAVAGTFTVYANYLTQTLNATVNFIDNLITSLTITGAKEVRVGESISLAAVAFYESGDLKVVTNVAAWNSSQPAIASVASGIVMGITPGRTDISASYEGADATPLSVTVYAGPTSLDVTPGSAFIEQAGTTQLTATATFDDASTLDVTNTATWSSSNTSIATVDNAGKVTAVNSGTANIKGRYTEHGITIEDSAVITVSVPGPTLTSLSVNPATAKIARNGTIQLTATAHYSDGSTRDVTVSGAIYESSNPSAATVNATGLVSGTGNTGSSSIKVTYSENGVTKEITSQINVLRSVIDIVISPNPIGLRVGQTSSPFSMRIYFDDGTNALAGTGENAYQPISGGNCASYNLNNTFTGLNACTAIYRFWAASPSLNAISPTSVFENVTVNVTN